MAHALESPATLRREVERCERLAECPPSRDLELMRTMDVPCTRHPGPAERARAAE